MEAETSIYATQGWLMTLYIVDKILFALYFVPICYLLVFAIGSTFNRRKTYSTARKEYNYAVFVVVAGKEQVILKSVESLLNQSYPKENFDIIVIHSEINPLIKQQLSLLPVQLLRDPNPNPNGAEAIKYAIGLPTEKIYDVALVMQGDSIAETDFLRKINNTYHSGARAIQTHRKTANLESDTALFGAVSEEINNAIFRKGHVYFGLSSALIGSGMAFNFEWLRKNIACATSLDLEKQLEELLLKQQIFIEYLESATFYNEKAENVSEFYNQRNAWLTNHIEIVKILLQKLPSAILLGRYDYGNKLFQWLLPSRTILIGTLVIIPIFLLFISWGMTIKWIFALLLLIVAFSVALPDYLIDARFVKALRSAPMMFVATAFNIVKRRVNKNSEQNTSRV